MEAVHFDAENQMLDTWNDRERNESRMAAFVLGRTHVGIIEDDEIERLMANIETDE